MWCVHYQVPCFAVSASWLPFIHIQGLVLVGDTSVGRTELGESLHRDVLNHRSGFSFKRLDITSLSFPFFWSGTCSSCSQISKNIWSQNLMIVFQRDSGPKFSIVIGLEGLVVFKPVFFRSAFHVENFGSFVSDYCPLCIKCCNSLQILC